MIKRRNILIFTFVVITAVCFLRESYCDDKEEAAYKKQDIEGGTFNFITLTGKEVKEKDFKLGPGMEVISVKGTNVVVPKGTRVEDKGSWIKFEDPGEFLGRRLEEIETRLHQLQVQQEQLIQELKQLKETLEEQKKRNSILE